MRHVLQKADLYLREGYSCSQQLIGYTHTCRIPIVNLTALRLTSLL